MPITAPFAFAPFVRIGNGDDFRPPSDAEWPFNADTWLIEIEGKLQGLTTWCAADATKEAEALLLADSARVAQWVSNYVRTGDVDRAVKLAERKGFFDGQQSAKARMLVAIEAANEILEDAARAAPTSFATADVRTDFADRSALTPQQTYTEQN